MLDTSIISQNPNLSAENTPVQSKLELRTLLYVNSNIQ